MHVWVSSPFSDPPAAVAPLFRRLREKWMLAVANARRDGFQLDITFHTPPRPCTHGELLTELWNERIVDSEDDVHLISEIDVVPSRRALSYQMQALRIRGARFVTVPYLQRRYEETQSAVHGPGKLVTANGPDGNQIPWAWWLCLNLPSAARRRVPERWLDAGGPFNDAANLALSTGLEEGLFDQKEVLFLALKDDWPVTHGIRIPGVARHLLYARHWADPPEAIIDYPKCVEPLRVRHHLDDVRRSLR